MNVRRRLIPAAAATAVTAAALGTLSACSSGSSAAVGNTDRFDVVASFYPMAFLAEQIGGDHVNVTSLTQPGQEPHDLEISAKQAAQLEETDAALYLKGLQPTVDEAIGQSGVRTKIDAATLTSLDHDAGGHGDEHGHDDDHGHDDGHSHSHDGQDPHVWLDPVKYAEIAEGVGKAFQKADPDHAADYKKNTEALVGKLNDLDAEFEAGLEHRKTDVFVTTHAAFGHLAARYGLTEEAINGLDPESEPSAARVKQLTETARADGVTTVFYETLISDRTAKTVARDAGLKTDVLDPLEGITDKSRGDDYFQVMESNLRSLQTALGAK
ncbi:zinc ABC transporter substrate-binding protein [Streptomyces sp. M2CJ-2]|uniref:metal ABC transporter substrate-binding protein n=1 Tax=Streptomyces sp. M2CJ-2 TaxID=2803948 RepID=UPI00192939E6|nr:metal ABC transporter substrate-binding protein [Streptomyces sp. M2CJ-2]MBL3669459.1 zinc ABC transporter substrate-binding protein [Streptomyces sp. M2CJ-2]